MITELYAHLIDVVGVKATIVVGAATLICYALRRSSAALRQGVWAAAFLVLLALPALQAVTPRSSFPVVSLASPAATSSHDAPDVANGALAPSEGARISTVAARSVTTAQTARPIPGGNGAIYAWIVAIWAAGMIWHLVRFGAHLLALRRLRRRARPCPPDVERRTREVATELGLRRVPSTLVSSEVTVPNAFGLIRLTVMLPPCALRWPRGQLEAALLHELAHLRRGDYLTHLIAALVRTAYWINPAVWYASRRLDTERERSCDDGVVSRIDPIRYAEYLVGLAWSGRRTVAQPMLSLTGGSSLRERVRSLLDRAQTRTPVGRVTRLAIVATAAAVALGAAAVEIVGIAQATQQHAASLSDPDPLVRRRAAWALGEAESRAHVDALIARLTDADPRVRVVSAWALGEIKDPRAVQPLIALLAHQEPRVREMAVLAIGEIEDPAGLAAVRGAGPSVVSAEARAWAIAQIEHAEVPEVFAGQLEEAESLPSELSRHLEQLRSRDPASRAAAAQRLGAIGDPAAVDPLLDALEDEAPAVRAAAIWALDEINPSRDRARSPG